MTNARPRVWLDCDPGHDDAFALLYAAQRTDLVGISTVSGNVGLASTTRNARIVRDLAGSTVPLHQGAAGPLVGEPLHAPDIHGESGLDGPTLPEPRGAVDPMPAVHAILEASRAHDDLWLVPTGPLTNIALALRIDPSLATRVKGISLMGGSRTYGNTTPAAEFNILADPEAADVVFRSGAKILMAGLDLTHQFRLGAKHVADLDAVSGPITDFTADLLRFFLAMYEKRSGLPSAPMHDPCAVMVLTRPDLFETEAFHVSVELQGTHTRGMTLCDQRERHMRGEPNATVLMKIAAEDAWSELLGALRAYDVPEEH